VRDVFAARTQPLVYPPALPGRPRRALAVRLLACRSGFILPSAIASIIRGVKERPRSNGDVE
jgi:hypothetical protein